MSSLLSRLSVDRSLALLVSFLAWWSVALVALVVGFVALQSWPALSQVGISAFLDPTQPWYPLEGHYGMLPMVMASVVCALGALALAVPLGLAAALFNRFYGPSILVRPFRWVIGLLAGIPSVVYGLWGLTVLVPSLAHWAPPGASVLAGVLILALMVLPTIALTAESALAAVPASLAQGAHALGLNEAALVLKVLIPAARHGIQAGIVLAVARALGETMAVLMVTGNVVAYPAGLLEPVRTLTANMALEMAYAMELHRSGLFFSGVMLALTCLLLALLARRFAGRL